MYLRIVSVFCVLLFNIHTCTVKSTTFSTNLKPNFEALKTRGFRASFPDVPGMNNFALHCNINEDIDFGDPGIVNRETSTTIGGFWIVEFSNKLKIGDRLKCWQFATINHLGTRRDGISWVVTELKDSYTTPNGGNSNDSSTTINGEKTASSGDPIFEDNFSGSFVDASKWIVEHRIPTYYAGPSYEFNSYENIDKTRFLKDGKLYLKPIALQSEEEVRGILNLREGCTSTDDSQCYFEQITSFILPPVKSAKITSKISFKYGKVEIRAKFPAGDWIFPIIQLEPKGNNGNGENATKLWIAYSRGNIHLTKNKEVDIGSSLLFAGPVIHPSEPARSKHLVVKRAKNPYNDDFHVYTIEWIPGKMTFYLDGVEYGTVISKHGLADPSLGIGDDWTEPDAPFNKEYVLSLGVGVGGFNDFPDNFMSGNNPKPWVNKERNSVKKFFEARNTWLSTWIGDNVALQVDYVKVWKV